LQDEPDGRRPRNVLLAGGLHRQPRERRAGAGAGYGRCRRQLVECGRRFEPDANAVQEHGQVERRHAVEEGRFPHHREVGPHHQLALCLSQRFARRYEGRDQAGLPRCSPERQGRVQEALRRQEPAVAADRERGLQQDHRADQIRRQFAQEGVLIPGHMKLEPGPATRLFACPDARRNADIMTVAVSILPSQQLAALNGSYRKAVARKRVRFTLAAAVFFAALVLASIGAEVNLRTFLTHFGNFVSYFDRILSLEDGTRVWINIAEWLWGWRKWSLLLGETILISYVGTLSGAVLAFALNFLAAENTAPALWLRVAVKLLMEFCRTVPDIVFALIFVIAFGLGPMAGVLAITIHSIGALGKQYAEIVENIDMKPVEGVRSTGASWISCMRFAVLPQVAAGFAGYTLLRFEINVRGASVMGFVGAGGIGQELVVAIRKFYYSDVSAILLMIVLTVFVIDIGTGWILGRLFG